MTISEAKRRVQYAISGLDYEIENNIIPQAEDDIIEMQMNRLWEGVLVDGSSLPDYTPYTKRIKEQKGQPTDRMTLRDTGAFYNQIFAKVNNSEVIIDSRDEKSEELKDRYGEQIFGLTDENKIDIKEITTGLLIDYVKNITGFE